MDNEVEQINNEIKKIYIEYKIKYADISKLTDQIKELEEKKFDIMEKSGKKLMFIKPVLFVRPYLDIIKRLPWFHIEYEGFDENDLNPNIVDQALICSVFCYLAVYNEQGK